MWSGAHRRSPLILFHLPETDQIPHFKSILHTIFLVFPHCLYTHKTISFNFFPSRHLNLFVLKSKSIVAVGRFALEFSTCLLTKFENCLLELLGHLLGLRNNVMFPPKYFLPRNLVFVVCAFAVLKQVLPDRMHHATSEELPPWFNTVHS